eukprot:3977330-Amphidinium_carterae.1
MSVPSASYAQGRHYRGCRRQLAPASRPRCCIDAVVSTSHDMPRAGTDACGETRAVRSIARVTSPSSARRATRHSEKGNVQVSSSIGEPALQASKRNSPTAAQTSQFFISIQAAAAASKISLSS